MDNSPVVLVTGVSSGTGLCAAVELAQQAGRSYSEPCGILLVPTRSWRRAMGPA